MVSFPLLPGALIFCSSLIDGPPRPPRIPWEEVVAAMTTHADKQAYRGQGTSEFTGDRGKLVHMGTGGDQGGWESMGWSRIAGPQSTCRQVKF